LFPDHFFLIQALCEIMKTRKIVLVTGLSGSGRRTALNALEDEGYYCIDNMPVRILPQLLSRDSENIHEERNLALGMDLRDRNFTGDYREVFERLRDQGCKLEVLFLEASEEALLRRFSQTRRLHQASEDGDLVRGIRSEKAQLEELRRSASRVIDTSGYTIHQLKDVVIQYACNGFEKKRMQIRVLSFGFKHGLPLESDLLIDVRFIPNPYFVKGLQGLDGKDERVQGFIKKWPETGIFLEKYFSLLEFLITLYEKEGKAYLTLGVGCTGGRHRSVTIAEEIFSRLNSLGRECTLFHRDIELE